MTLLQVIAVALLGLGLWTEVRHWRQRKRDKYWRENEGL